MGKQHYPNQIQLRSLALEAGETMKQAFTTGMAPGWKEDNTPLTESDGTINHMVLQYLHCAFPHIGMIGEEGSRGDPNSEYVAIVDPIDGTIPFSSGIQASTFCIAILRNYTPISALIYDPFGEREWYAEKGRGTIMDGKLLKVSPLRTLEHSLISICWWDNAAFNFGAVCDEIMRRKAKWINLCSVAICGGLIASGQMHASLFPGTKAWETAAMQLIVEEAGGKATDLQGRPLAYGPDIKIAGHIISNGVLHDTLFETIQAAERRTRMDELLRSTPL